MTHKPKPHEQTQQEWFDETIEIAKRHVMRKNDSHPEEMKLRKWKCASVDSYDEPRYRCSLYVWEGSPPRGFVFVNRVQGIVRALDHNGSCLYTWKWKYALQV